MNRTFFIRSLVTLSALLTTGCLIGRAHSYCDELARVVGTEERRARRAAADSAADEAGLAREARLDTILKLARARNPDFAETRECLRAALTGVPAAAGLPTSRACGCTSSSPPGWRSGSARPWPTLSLAFPQRHLVGPRPAPVGETIAKIAQRATWLT